MSCCLVTSYFNIGNKSKFNDGTYKKWISNFLANIKTPIVCFCDKESEKYISVFNKNGNIKIITKSISDFKVYKKYKDEFTFHHSIDPEKKIHSPELYMIWAEKTNFVYTTMTEISPGFDYYMWCDIGTFRDKCSPEFWPVIKPGKIQAGKICVNNISGLDFSKFSKNYLFTHSKELLTVGGGFFVGDKNAIEKWNEEYYKTLEFYFANKVFAGKDQYIMATVCVNRPDLVELILPSGSGNHWFFFHSYFS